MQKTELLSAIVDATDSFIYVSDIENHEILYVNRAVCELFQASEQECLGRPCYEVIQGLDAPCSFCTNKMLSSEKFYVWKHYNASLGKNFMVRDKLMEYNGKLVRLEIATDISEMEQYYLEMQNRLSVNETLLNCIDTLKNNQDMDAAIRGLLYHVCNFYQAERAYIFEIDWKKHIFYNTYEWCSEGVQPQIDNLKEIPLEALGRWLDSFDRDGFVSISSLGKNVSVNSAEYEILQAQDIESLIAAPLINSKNIKEGFIGVDNPTVNFESAGLLCNISNFVLDDLHKRTLMMKLDRLSFEDALTGVQNRNAYLKQIQELEEEPPAALGIVYLDINGLKEANDKYGHAFGDVLIVHTAQLLRRVYGANVFRVGGDEFVVLYPKVDEESFARMEKEFRAVVKEENLSVSLGVYWKADGHNATLQIKQADEYMYREKEEYYRMNSRVMYAAKEVSEENK